MKLKPFQIAIWCDALCRRRRWLPALASSVLILLAASLYRLFWPALTALLYALAVEALYLLHRCHAFGKAYQRTPRPTDAQAETVLIDAALIGHGVRLQAAAQPVNAVDSLSMRMGSGALLLGSAMVITADALPPAERAAVYNAVEALNIKPHRMHLRNPVLHRKQTGHVTAVTVRDGGSNRSYFLGSPADVAARCTLIWEDTPREMTEHDRARIADTAACIAQGECRLLAYATAQEDEAPTFLGLCSLGEEVLLPALTDVATLRGMGLTVMLSGDPANEAELISLRALMDLPEHHARADLHLTPKTTGTDVPLGITRQPGDSLAEPVILLRNRFTLIEDTLRRFAQLMAVPMAVSLLAGGRWIAIWLTLYLLSAGIWVGADLTAPGLRWPTAAICCMLALLSRLFLGTQPAGLGILVAQLIALTAGYCAMRRLCGYGFRFSRQLHNPALWLNAASAALLLVQLALALIRYGLACLLPLGFGMLISAAVALVIMPERKFLR